MSVNNRLRSSGSSSTSSGSDRLADRFSQELDIADNLFDRARAEFKERKTAKKDRKTFCGHCGKHKEEGMKLQTCSLCRFVQVYLCVCFALTQMIYIQDPSTSEYPCSAFSIDAEFWFKAVTLHVRKIIGNLTTRWIAPRSSNHLSRKTLIHLTVQMFLGLMIPFLLKETAMAWVSG